MKRILSILLFLSVINGVFARGNFYFDIEFKTYFRIATSILIVYAMFIGIKEIRFKYIEIFILISSFILVGLTFREEVITAIYIIIFIKLFERQNPEWIIKKLNKANIIALILIFVFLFTGLSIPEVWIHSKYGSTISHDISSLFNKSSDARVRFTFGMNHPNSFVGFVTSLITFIFILFRKKYSFILTGILTLVTYYFTDSRSIIIYSLMLFFVYYFVRIFRVKVFTYVPVLLAAFTFILSILFAHSKLNELLSNRLFLWNSYLLDLSLKDFFLGKSLEGYIIDNSYLHLILGTGVIFFIYFLYMTSNAIRVNLNINNTKIVAFLVSYLFFNFNEAYLLRFENASTILFWYFIFKTYNETERHSKVKGA